MARIIKQFQTVPNNSACYKMVCAKTPVNAAFSVRPPNNSSAVCTTYIYRAPLRYATAQAGIDLGVRPQSTPAPQK